MMFQRTTRELKLEMDGLVQALTLKVDCVRELMLEKFAASKEAITKNENAQHEYNVRSNEFRGQLDDQAKRLIPRTEVEALMRAVQERHDVSVKSLEDKIGVNDREIRAVRESVTVLLGKSQGMDKIWGYIIAAITAAGAVGVTIAFVAK